MEENWKTKDLRSWKLKSVDKVKYLGSEVIWTQKFLMKSETWTDDIKSGKHGTKMREKKFSPVMKKIY